MRPPPVYRVASSKLLNPVEPNHRTLFVERRRLFRGPFLAGNTSPRGALRGGGGLPASAIRRPTRSRSLQPEPSRLLQLRDMATIRNLQQIAAPRGGEHRNLPKSRQSGRDPARNQVRLRFPNSHAVRRATCACRISNPRDRPNNVGLPSKDALRCARPKRRRPPLAAARSRAPPQRDCSTRWDRH